MKYSTIIPDSALEQQVECYWSVKGTDTVKQKIIPDGFPEIIFHFADSYELFSDKGEVYLQPEMLISGQISRPLTLRATGRSDVFGIKFKPWGIWQLFGIDMRQLRDNVSSLSAYIQTLANEYAALKEKTEDERVQHLNEFLLSQRTARPASTVEAVLLTIESHNGNIPIQELCWQHKISPRTLQRIFQQHIGITAKQYGRITRFKKVYGLLQKPKLTKTDSLFLTGYFDQPHFNREFREFTNDNPDQWFSKTNEFSNLFMNR
jgi:methylphosphotriester-DNA--protein-cysteine methyltransferase